MVQTERTGAVQTVAMGYYRLGKRKRSRLRSATGWHPPPVLEGRPHGDSMLTPVHRLRLSLPVRDACHSERQGLISASLPSVVAAVGALSNCTAPAVRKSSLACRGI